MLRTAFLLAFALSEIVFALEFEFAVLGKGAKLEFFLLLII
jgi:hypothetical protein